MARRREAVGIAIEGLDVKMAYLSLEKGNMKIEALLRDTLLTRLVAGEKGEAQAAEETPAEEDVFGLEEEEISAEEGAEEEMVGEEEQSNASVLYGLLANVVGRKYHVGMNLPEGNLDYYPLEALSTKGTKLKKQVRERIQADREIEEEIPLERVECFRGERDTVIGVVHDGPIAAISELERLRPYAKGMLIELIDTNETALADLVKTNYELGEGEVTAIVYIGKEFSRVVFLRGQEWIGFCPLVNEGADSPQVCNTLLARILYEQDVSGVPDINRFILAGESVRIDAREFFATEFPNAQVEYLTVQAEAPQISGDEDQDLSSYAIPLAIAWKALDTRNPKFYPLNFLPARIRERQNVYKIGWHGMLVMLLVGVCAWFFAGQWVKRKIEIHDREVAIKGMETKIEAKQDTVVLIDSLQARIDFYDEETALVDTLTRGLIQWSDYLHKLARGTQQVGKLWFTDFSTGGGDISLAGNSLLVASLSPMSYRLESCIINGYTRQQIRGQDVYAYKMTWKLLEAETEVGK